MIEFGKSLRLAREAKGYSIAQLAEATRLAPGLITDLENEEFGQIAAPIYGRGFVKLYCEAVGLAPKPFIDEFMEILNGNREPHVKERTTPAAPVEKPDASPEPMLAPPPQQDLFRQERPPADRPKPIAVAPSIALHERISQHENAMLQEAGEPSAAPVTSPKLTRYAAPFRMMRVPPPAFWRIGALVLVVLALLALVVLGFRALRRTTTPAAQEEPQPAAQSLKDEKPVKAETAEHAAPRPRTLQSIPSIYID